MKISKSQLKQIIKEEIETLNDEQQLNENPAVLAQIAKHLPEILELVKMMPQLTQMMQSMGSGESGGPTPGATPASE